MHSGADNSKEMICLTGWKICLSTCQKGPHVCDFLLLIEAATWERKPQNDSINCGLWVEQESSHIAFIQGLASLLTVHFYCYVRFPAMAEVT